MPSGRPKLSPQPEWIIGTMASTMMAFQLKRLMTFSTCVPKLTPATGVSANSRSRKPVIISRGMPKLSSS